MTVIFKVIEGGRPDRPPFGFSDKLWKLLMKMWVEQRVKGTRRRPSASTVLDGLKQDVDRWEKSIMPLIPREWQESGGYNTSPNKSIARLRPPHSSGLWPCGGHRQVTLTTGPITLLLT